MWDLKACIVCFSSQVKLFKIDSGQLGCDYFSVSGLKASETVGMPQYLCVECSAYVNRFAKFRGKCKRAHFALTEILKINKQVTLSNLQSIDRKQIDIMPTLSYLNLNKSHYKDVKFQWVKHNRPGIAKNDTIPIFHYTTLTRERVFKEPTLANKPTPVIDEKVVKTETDEKVDLDEILEQSTSSVNQTDYFENDDYESDIHAQDELLVCKSENKDDQADGTEFDEEYANMIPISEKEMRAAVDIYKMFTSGNGDFECSVCSKSFKNEDRYNVHLRMHDKHMSGNFLCTLCNFYYKTEYMLKTHMTEKHLYKYVCRKCPEVSFDRISAKQHFIWTHLQKGSKKHANWYESRPSWVGARGGPRTKGIVSLRPVRKIKKLPEDFPVYSPIRHEEQYELVRARRGTRNYIDAHFKCELCYRGFREVDTYSNHMRKHDPDISGPLQCDMCKLYFRDARRMYKHMNITHLYKYSCQQCAFVCYNRGQAQMHYRWHKNVTYQCPHCSREFKKSSTRLTHIRIKHPSCFICNLCGHSYVSENGLYCHKKLAHTAQDIEQSESVVVNPADSQYCADCNVQFMSEAAFKTHLGSSIKHATTNLSVKQPRLTKAGERRRRGRPRNGPSQIVNNGIPTATECEVCGKLLSNDVQARKHYEAEHPGAEFLKRYMCHVCGHATRQYANLMVHMRTHTDEKPYGCPHCERRFSMPSNRNRHLVVHTGEKRFQCQHCNRRFTQSSAVKLHIQTVHLKIPYAPWDKKNRKRRKELEGTSAPVSAVVSAACLPPPPKLLFEPQGDYLNAYITYNE